MNKSEVPREVVAHLKGGGWRAIDHHMKFITFIDSAIEIFSSAFKPSTQLVSASLSGLRVTLGVLTCIAFVPSSAINLGSPPCSKSV